MSTERQHDSENVRLRHEVAGLKAEVVKAKKYVRQQMDAHSGLVRKNKELSSENQQLYRLICDIRKAAGDPEGRLMQDELVAYIAELKQAADAIRARNTSCDWPTWRATYQSDAQAAMSAFNALVEARKEIDYLRSIVDQGIA